MKYLQLFIIVCFICLRLTKPVPHDEYILIEKYDGRKFIAIRQHITVGTKPLWESDTEVEDEDNDALNITCPSSLGIEQLQDDERVSKKRQQQNKKHARSLDASKTITDKHCKCDAKWLKQYQGRRPADKPQTDYITGGTMVNDWKEWPWIAALNLYATNDADTDDDYEDIDICGGVLISCQHVVTALHCLVDDSTNKTYPPENIDIFLGSTKDGENGTKFTAVELFYKKDQDGKIELLPSKQNIIPVHDIAVIKLNRPINPYRRTDKDIRPIMLPTRALKNGDQYWIAGWGYIGHNNATDEFIETETLMQTDKIPIGNATNCRRVRHFNATHNICLILTWNDATCRGDSGSPGMIADEKGRWFLKGIESRGTHLCNRKKSRGTQMNVMYYKKDIEQWIAK